MLLQSCESPRATGSIKSSLASEVALGGCGYSTFIQTCAGCLKKEKIIKCSPRLELLGYVEHIFDVSYSKDRQLHCCGKQA